MTKSQPAERRSRPRTLRLKGGRAPTPAGETHEEKLRRLGTACIEDLRLAGRWCWTGTPDQPELSTATGGQRTVLGTWLGHEHYRYFTDWSESADRPCPYPGDSHTCFEPLTFGEDGETDRDAQGRFTGFKTPYTDGVKALLLLRFPHRPDGDRFSFMAASTEVPVFQVCPEATSKDDPRVYRTQVVGFNSPAADWLAAADPTTVLGLLDEVTALRAEVAALRAGQEATP